MAGFMENLWESVFVAGPTPTLLVATNVTFAALEMLLLALLFATHSIHFLILSVLSAALWWGINWFAREVQLAKAEEEKTLRDGGDPKTRGAAEDPDAGGDERDDEDTEVEGDDTKQRARRTQSSGSKATATGASARLGTAPLDESMRLRQQQQQQRHSMAESTGSLSTDSEWEKVDGEQ